MRTKSVGELQSAVDQINVGVKLAFSKVKEEQNVMLDSINQNTSEQDLLHQRIDMLERQLEKITERLDELTVTQNSTPLITEISAPLSLREQEVFIALYTADNAKSSVEIAKYIGLTQELVNVYIYKLISKGVPVITSNYGDSSKFELDSFFKDLQARKNIVKVNDSVLNEIQIKETIYS